MQVRYRAPKRHESERRRCSGKWKATLETSLCIETLCMGIGRSYNWPSDRLVVPRKSSNKPDIVGVEKMEGRGLPEENEKQQNMFRTLRREKCAQ